MVVDIPNGKRLQIAEKGKRPTKPLSGCSVTNLYHRIKIKGEQLINIHNYTGISTAHEAYSLYIIEPARG